MLYLVLNILCFRWSYISLIHSDIYKKMGTNHQCISNVKSSLTRYDHSNEGVRASYKEYAWSWSTSFNLFVFKIRSCVAWHGTSRLILTNFIIQLENLLKKHLSKCMGTCTSTRYRSEVKWFKIRLIYTVYRILYLLPLFQYNFLPTLWIPTDTVYT